jgi:hypothetical protein
MVPVTVADLARDGRMDSVAPDLSAAWLRLDEAKIHLASSAALASTDPGISYVALYDAARKAITAHMQAHSWRPTSNTPHRLSLRSNTPYRLDHHRHAEPGFMACPGVHFQTRTQSICVVAGSGVVPG